MKQEDKDLLLKDLCARLPYSTLVYAQNDIDWYESEICTQVLSDVINDDYVVKPYLFPLSSMTEEQRKDFRDFVRPAVTKFLDSKDYNVPTICSMAAYSQGIEWCLKNHFDYRGLIERGLAIDCTNLNIY